MGCCGEGKSETGAKPSPEYKGGHPEFYRILDKQAKLHDQKNTDYAAGGLQGPLGNFKRVSAIKQLYPGFDWSSPFGTAMDYMLKQLDAAFILYATKRKSITGEPIPSRLNDVSIYSNIGQIIYGEEEMLEALTGRLKREVTEEIAKQLELPFKDQPTPRGWVGEAGGK